MIGEVRVNSDFMHMPNSPVGYRELKIAWDYLCSKRGLQHSMLNPIYVIGFQNERLLLSILQGGRGASIWILVDF